MEAAQDCYETVAIFSSNKSEAPRHLVGRLEETRNGAGQLLLLVYLCEYEH
jgi:hypothetical protein